MSNAIEITVSDATRERFTLHLARKFTERIEREQEIIDAAQYHSQERVAQAQAVKAALAELLPAVECVTGEFSEILADEPSED